MFYYINYWLTHNFFQVIKWMWIGFCEDFVWFGFDALLNHFYLILSKLFLAGFKKNLSLTLMKLNSWEVLLATVCPLYYSVTISPPLSTISKGQCSPLFTTLFSISYTHLVAVTVGVMHFSEWKLPLCFKPFPFTGSYCVQGKWFIFWHELLVYIFLNLELIWFVFLLMSLSHSPFVHVVSWAFFPSVLHTFFAYFQNTIFIILN